jgi:hypothetical protein
MYREAGGIISSVENLKRKRFPALLALGEETTEEEVSCLQWLCTEPRY